MPGIVVIFYFLAPALFRVTAATSLIFKKQPPLRYVREGDLNLGVILPGLGFDRTHLCGTSSFMNSSFHFSETITYYIDKVNKNDSVLPDVRLGVVILDDCMKETTAAIQAISFVQTDATGGGDARDNATAHPDALESYDVVGVIGCLRSSNTMHAASILGPAEVPLVSFSSTSEALSDQEAYPYFLRVVPADNYLVDALVRLISEFGWTYISAVYVEGIFGEKAFQSLRTKLTALNGVCIATSHIIYQSFTQTEYERILKDLWEHKNARVVVAFTDPDINLNLLKASNKQGTGGYFLWLANDGWRMSVDSMNDKELIKSLAGSLVVGYESLMSDDYNDHVKGMNPSNNDNPWFRKFWSETFQCSLDDPTCASDHHATQLPGWSGHSYTLYAYDAVLTYAYAIEAIVKRKCPSKVGRDVRECVTGPDMLKALKNVSFYGDTGLVEFENGSVLARFLVEQFIPNSNFTSLNTVAVATYDPRNAVLKFQQKISFDCMSSEGDFRSECSKPCGVGEYIVKKEQMCCWDCRRCRSNEILIKDKTDCEPCPDFTWPDVTTNLTTCRNITPDYPDIKEPLVVLCLTSSIIGLTSVVMVTSTYIKHRSARIIKATSTELSYLQLFAIHTGFLTVPVLNVKPTDVLCITSFFMYCLSFTWLYAPLLVKAIRIYRIFQGGKRSKSRVKFISPRSQVIFTSLLISVQVLLCVIMTLVYKPSIGLTQVVKTENYVELNCNWTLPGLTSFLGYNLILVFLCSVFAFKTRKLPDNFNESRFISISVYTTLIVWLAFVPTYYTAERQYLKTLLLSLSLLVNHTVAVVFLYLPKIYAAVSMIPTTSNTVNGSLATGATRMDGLTATGRFVSPRDSSCSGNNSHHPSGEDKKRTVAEAEVTPGNRTNSDLSLQSAEIFSVSGADKISSA